MLKLTLPTIEICAARDVRRKITLSRLPLRQRITSVLSFENPGYEYAALRHPAATLTKKYGFAPRLPANSGITHSIMHFHDSNAPRAYQPATARHLLAVTNFAIDHAYRSPDAKLLLHCGWGVSRSTAATLFVLAGFDQAKNGVCNPEACVRQLLKIRPQAAPDMHIVRMADKSLGLRQALVKAVETNPQIKHNTERHRRLTY